jgi:hypothetical protein
MAEQETRPNRVPLIVLAWAWVVLPFAYGVYQLFLKLVQLFGYHAPKCGGGSYQRTKWGVRCAGRTERHIGALEPGAWVRLR